VSCRDVQANARALIMVFVIQILGNVYARKDGPETTVAPLTVQERRFALAMEVVATQIQEGAIVSRSGLVRSANCLA